MTLYQAIKIVKTYQQWRRGEIDDYETKPVSLGEAIDLLIENAVKTHESNRKKTIRKSKKMD